MSENKGIDYSTLNENSNETIFLREEFNQIKEKIEFPEAGKPKLRITEFGVQQWGRLKDNIKKAGPEEIKVIGNVRAWNKDKQTIINADGAKILGLEDLLTNLRKVRKEVPYLKGAFIIIDQNGEKDDKTEKNLQELYRETGSDFPIIPIYIDGYCWTSGLNAGAALAEQTFLKENVNLEKAYLMSYSFDVSVPTEELKKCRESLDENQDFFFTLRYTKDNHHPMAEQERGTLLLKVPAVEEIKKGLKRLIKKPETEEYDPLVYSMRNTFNFLRMSRLHKMGGWNPACSGDRYELITETEDLTRRPAEDRAVREIIAIKGGMEDAEYFKRVIEKAFIQLKSKDVKERLEGRKTIRGFFRCLEKPIFYEDASWKQIHEVAGQKKTTRETSAFGKILAYMNNAIELRLAKNPSISWKINFGSDKKTPENIQEFKI
jgi:hypothetical protein